MTATEMKNAFDGLTSGVDNQVWNELVDLKICQ